MRKTRNLRLVTLNGKLVPEPQDELLQATQKLVAALCELTVMNLNVLRFNFKRHKDAA